MARRQGGQELHRSLGEDQMQPALTLKLLGSFEVNWDGQPLRIAMSTARALLAYLAVEADRPINRARLSTLLWPNHSTTSASNNLRQTLLRMRKAFPNPSDLQSVLQITRDTVQFKRAAARGDVFRFEDLLAECALHTHSGTGLHDSPATCADCARRMQEAVGLYRGEFLSDLLVDDCPPFEEWMLFKRERLHRQALEALSMLAQHYEATGHFEAMRGCAARQLALEPWHEEAHAQLMRALVYLGDRTAALAQYDACRQVLQTELGIEPTNALRDLAERVRAGSVEKPQVALPPPPPPAILPAETMAMAAAPNWHHIPDSGPLFGRERELAQLHQWLVHDRSRLVWVLGMGGVGKTSLAAAVADASSAQFDVIFWRSLLNAPPGEEVLRAALQTLSQNGIVELPTSLDEQLALLLDLMRQRRCLLVLDNFESILQTGERATYRPGYAAYDQLIQLVVTNRHQSCMLITSREQPRETARLDGTAGVHVLRLTGLAPDAGREMLAAYRLGDEKTRANDVSTLVRRYSGNPLALKLVAQTVQELFMGSIGDFLSTDTPIFDDVRTVLDSQFERLAPLQREIMTTLAVAREGMTITALREALLHPRSPHEFLEALRTLQGRSLVEHAQTSANDALDTPAQPAAAGGAVLTLQNVILEYATGRLIDEVCREVETGTFDLLNRHALLNVRAKEYVRQSQVRLIVKPIAEQLLARLGAAGIERQLHHLLAVLHQAPPRTPSYAPGNILNLLMHLGFDVASYDFSRLCVWQADLRGVKSAALNFAESDLSRSAFTVAFSVSALRLDDTNTVHIAGMSDGELCLWQAKEGQLRHAAHNVHPSVNPVTFSADGRFLAHSSPNCSIYVCAADDGRVLRILAGHAGKIERIAFNRDGSLLASCSHDGTFRIWDARTGDGVQLLREQVEGLLCLAFSSDSALLVGGGERRTLVMWDVRTGHVVRTLSGHQREVECCAFSPDGTRLASGSHEGEIRIWDACSGQLQRAFTAHGHIVRALAFHPDGHMLASCGADGTVRLWQASTGQLLHDLMGHQFDVISLAFSPDGRRLASGSTNKGVRIWDIAMGYALDVFSGHSYLSPAARFNPDPEVQQLVSTDFEGSIHVWDLRTGTSKSLRGDAVVIFDLAYSPDGRQLISGGGEGVVRVWDTATLRCVHELRGHTGTVKAVAVGADGNVIASGGTDRDIRLWQTVRPDAVTVLRGHEDDVIDLAFAPDDQRLVSGSLDHTARVWDVRVRPGASSIQAELCHVLRGQETALYCIALTADGQRIVTNTWGYDMNWWDANTGERITNQAVTGLKGIGVMFSPDGALFAVSTDKSIEVRDSVTQSVLRVLNDKGQRLAVLDFDATSSRLVSADNEGILCVWDVRTGACLYRLSTPGPYAGTDITGVVGISEAQRAALRELGAVSDGVVKANGVDKRNRCASQSPSP